jgi:hypothetical protein
VPVEWRAGVAQDVPGAVEWGLTVSATTSPPVAILSQLAGDLPVQADWLQTQAVGYEIPIDWTQATFSVATDAVIPLEWVRGVSVDQTFNLEWPSRSRHIPQTKGGSSHSRTFVSLYPSHEVHYSDFPVKGASAHQLKPISIRADKPIAAREPTTKGSPTRGRK